MTIQSLNGDECRDVESRFLMPDMLAHAKDLFAQAEAKSGFFAPKVVVSCFLFHPEECQCVAVWSIAGDGGPENDGQIGLHLTYEPHEAQRAYAILVRASIEFARDGHRDTLLTRVRKAEGMLDPWLTDLDTA